MKKIVLLTILFAALFVPDYAKAVNMEGFYVGATGAADFLSNTGRNHRRGSGSGYGFRRSNRNRYDTGFFGAIDLGYRWCSGLRLEAEVAYRYNRQRKNHRRHGYGSFESTRNRRGHRDVWAAMVNVLYDINMCWCVEPYVGVGIGYAHVRNSRHNRFQPFSSFSYSDRRRRRHNRHDDNAFAWQIIAGIAYPICDNIDVAVEYRFFDAVRSGRSERRNGYGNRRDHRKNQFDNSIGVNLRYFF